MLVRLKTLSKTVLKEMLTGRAKQLAEMPPPKRAKKKAPAKKTVKKAVKKKKVR